MNQELKYSLEKLEMIDDANHSIGLIPVRQTTENKDLPPEEIIALENAVKYGAQYVYYLIMALFGKIQNIVINSNLVIVPMKNY